MRLFVAAAVPIAVTLAPLGAPSAPVTHLVRVDAHRRTVEAIRIVPVTVPRGALPSLPQFLPLVMTTTTSARGRGLHRYPPGAAPVTLSFDDGPNAVFTPLVLDVLEHYGVRATFFLVGKNVTDNPDLVRRELADGDVIGNHTWDHADLTTLDDNGFKAEIDHTEQLLATFVHADVPCVRPPYGRIDAFARGELHRRGLAVMRWTADTGDWRQPGVPAIVQRALAGAHPGAVILMHDSYTETLDALPAIIVGIEELGLRIAPVCGLHVPVVEPHAKKFGAE